MIRPKVVLLVVLVVLMLILVVQNTEPVSVQVLLWEFTMSRVILILLTTLIGFLGGFLVAKLTGGGRRRVP